MTDEKKQHPDYGVGYLEFHVPAVASAKKFYGDAFGWTFEDWGPDYASFGHENVAGGFTNGPVSASGAPLVILYASRLEEAQAPSRRRAGREDREADLPVPGWAAFPLHGSHGESTRDLGE